MTKRENFTAIETILRENGHADLADVMAHEIEMLGKKRSSNTKAKAETEARAELVYSALAEMEKPVTITELLAITENEEVAGYTNQRVSALIRKLGNRVVSEKVKGKTYFTVA